MPMKQSAKPIEILFPTIYHLFSHQSNTTAQDLFSEIMRGLKDGRQIINKIMLNQRQRQKLIDKLGTSEKFATIYFCEYSCALILHRKQVFAPVSVNIVFPKQWSFASYLSQDKILYLADHPKSSTSLQIGSIHKDQSLQLAKQSLRNQIIEILRQQQPIHKSKKDKDRKNHHTPTYLLQIVKQALKRWHSQIPIKNEDNRKSEIFSKGGTLDVGIHTGTTHPNTSAAVVISCLQFILQSPKLVKLMMFAHRLQVLKSSIESQTSFNKQKIKQYQKCLCLMISQFKSLVDEEIEFDQEYFTKEIEMINQKMGALFKPLPNPTITNKQLAHSIIMVNTNEHFILKNIRKYDVKNNGVNNQLGNLGFSKSLSNVTCFKHLLELKSLFPQNYWVMIVQGYFFSLAVEKLGPQNTFIDVSVQQIKCAKNGLSKMHEVIYHYGNIVKQKEKAKNLGMKLQNQSYSHYCLLRQIGAAIAFEVIKYQRRNSKANLQGYRCPSSIVSLYKSFYSLSFESRQALQSMIRYYERNSTKTSLFNLQEENKSYYKFINQLAEEDYTMKSWKTNKKKELDTKIENMEYELQKFKAKYERYKSEKQAELTKNCTCYYEEVKYRRRVQKQLRKCQKCKTIEDLTLNINNCQNSKADNIIASYAEHEVNLYAFLQNIPLEILGMIKMVFENQISMETKPQPNDQNFFSTNYNELVIYAAKIKQGKFNLAANYTKSAHQFVLYPPKQTKFLFRGHSRSTRIEQDLLSPQKYQPNLFGQSHQYMANSPNSISTTREHEIYSKLNLKKKDESIEDYISFGCIRVATHTELIMLSEKLKNRQVLIKFLIENQDLKTQKEKDLFMKTLIVLNSSAYVQSFKYYYEENLTVFPLIKQCIIDTLKNYLNKWKYQDMYFLHIIGVIFSLWAKLVNAEKYLLQIAERAFADYQNFSRQNSSGDNTVKSQLAYFLHGTFSFFSQDITNNLHKSSVHLWTKLHLFYRINKIFSDQNLKDKRFRETMSYFQHYRERSIFNNIDNVLKYFQSNPLELTTIIKIIDNDLDPQTKWAYCKQKGDYVFTGTKEGKTYELNLFTGVLLKNGSQLAGLAQVIKKNKTYIQIFGQNRDLQVYPQKDGSVRTRSDFSCFFPNEPNATILFQFKIDDKNVVIRKIIKRNNQQIKYILIPEHVLFQSNVQLPEMYAKLCFAWYSWDENILVFRMKQLQEMKNVNLVILLKLAGPVKLKIIQARIIQNNLKLQSIDVLKQHKCTEMFDLLMFYPKAGSKAIEMISSIQHPAYILQISSPNRSQKNSTRLTKFRLHRYNLTFTFSLEKGLLSDNYQGYAIAQDYDSHQYLPWKREDKVKCLMLKKIDNNLRHAKNHNFVVLVPNTAISISQLKNPIPTGSTTQMKIFSYQLHDHFHDIRSKKMLEQIHLAGLAAVSHSTTIMMPNIDYAIHLLRSCESIKPLSKQQQSKLQNILNNAIKLNQYQLILICQVIFRSARLLENILPYEKRKKTVAQLQQSSFFKNNQLIQNCKLAYRSMFASQQISVRSQLSQLQLKILRIDNYEGIQANSVEDGRWSRKYKAQIAFPQNYRVKMDEWANYLKESYEIKRSILDANKSMVEVQNKETLINIEQNCQMSIDQKKEIQSSLMSYSNIKKKLNLLNLKSQEKELLMNKFTHCKKRLEGCSRQILQMIDQIQKNKSNLSFISKKRSQIKQIDFTRILCNQQQFLLFYPQTSQQNIGLFKDTLKLWMQINIEFNSIERILQISKDEELDKINLLREIQSPRKKISKNIAWIAFEMELKTQIWLSQYQTFKLLESNISGVVTQLNMGEGKTQVIIPMIVLNQIYNKKTNIPRVNILTPLYPQAQENYFKFLSITGFKLHLLPISFNRQVAVNSNTINKLQYAIDLFRHNSLVLVDRDSTLSMILKLREEYGFKKQKLNQNFQLSKKCHKKDRWIFRNQRILDIFDEVDALMTSKKSFVYAVGNASQLPHSRIRYEYSQLFLEIILKQLIKYLLDQQMAVIQQSFDNAVRNIVEGRYPKGFRLLTKIPFEKIITFRTMLIDLFLTKYIPPQFQFYKILSSSERESLITYCTRQNASSSLIPSGLTRMVFEQIYLVRGLLAYGVIQHCLTLRNGVDYGAPGKDNLKRVGVPYEAADMPSKRSEYSHPEVATILSYLSYYNKGLSFVQFAQALKCLLRQTSSSQQRNYRQWIKCIEKQSVQPPSAKEVQQINQESVLQKQQLYRSFRYCRATVAFWLVHCVFPNDLAQYTKSITSSSWDLADSKNSVGFSGTKDTHWLFPEYLYLKQSANDEINGTDGKMIQLMLQNTIDVLSIQVNNQDLWKRFCQTALQLKSGCIIDVGAILAGKSLEREIVPWISNHPLFKKLYFKGISYCTEGVWKVYDTTTHSTIARETSIPQHETFVIFDQARTRGADIKLKTQTIAALSLGPYMTKDKLMQAVGRLRKFGRNQKIYLLSTEQNFKKIDGFNINSPNSDKTKLIVEWVCRNSINDNKKMLYPNSKLAWIHFNNTKSKEEVVVQQFDPSLKKMYEGQIRFDTIERLNKEMAYSHIQKFGDCQLVIYLQENIEKYGDKYNVRCQSLEDICEREIEMIEETQKETQIQAAGLEAIGQYSGISIFKGSISSLDIELDRRLLFTSNFIKCTKSKIYSYRAGEEDNQLSHIHFVLIKPIEKQMIVLTQREANSKIQEGICCLGPQNVDDCQQREFIVRFADLSIRSLIISKLSLERALTDAQFFNGKQNFQDKQLIYQTIRKNYKQLQLIQIERIVCHFLERRRTVEDKYACSHLEQVFKQLISSK